MKNIVPLAVAFEGGLGLVGVALCAWLGVPLIVRLEVNSDVALRAVAVTAAMLAMLVALMRTRWCPIVELRKLVGELVGELFRGTSLSGLAMVAIAAGVGEELLFRGALQPLAERWLGAAAGLIAVSVLFGAVHAASWIYFLLATAIGLFFGVVAQRYDDLVSPIAAHAIYDFAALCVLRGYARESAAPPRSHNAAAETECDQSD